MDKYCSKLAALSLAFCMTTMLLLITRKIEALSKLCSSNAKKGPIPVDDDSLEEAKDFHPERAGTSSPFREK